MWFFSSFWRLIRGFWRLLVGLVIGAILYVWMFFEFKNGWQAIHHKMTEFMDWLVAQPMLVDYSQWNTLLNLDDKLTFALFIMMGRILWLVVEATLFSFPAWLIFGRKGAVTPLGANGIPTTYLDDVPPPAGGQKAAATVPSPVIEQPSSKAIPTQTPPVQQGTGLENAIDTANVPDVPAEALASIATSKLAVGLDGLQEKAGNLERSIDETLERIDAIGEDKTS